MLEKLLAIGIPILISIFALWVSMRTRQDANENNRQQILVGKIEEIYEIVTTLHYYYSPLLFVFKQLNESHNSKFTAQERDNFRKEYKRLVDQFVERNDVNELYHKVSRLKVLSNTYLRGELQFRCLTYNDMFVKLIDTVLYEQKIFQEIFYPEGFPENLILHNYLESLQEELIDLINLGGKSLKVDDIAEYRESTFKYDVGVKKSQQ